MIFRVRRGYGFIRGGWRCRLGFGYVEFFVILVEGFC